MVAYLKTLTLELDGTAVECQLTTALLTSETEGAETLTTFCGAEDVPGVAKYTLTIGGYSDWQSAQSVCDIVHQAFVNGQDIDPGTSDVIDFVLETGGKTRTGQARPTTDMPFGGDAGAAMTFTIDLSVIGTPTDGEAAA